MASNLNCGFSGLLAAPWICGNMCDNTTDIPWE